MKKRSIIAGALALALAGLFFWYQYSSSRHPFQFIHADRYKSEHRWSPSFGGGWSSMDYYVFRGDAKTVADEAKRELSGRGSWYDYPPGGFYNWRDEKGELRFYIGPYSPLDYLDDPPGPAKFDSAHWVVVHVFRPPNVPERIREWLPEHDY